MKIKTLIKGLVGLALIYLVCLPILTVAKAVEAKNCHTKLERKVEFNPTGRARSISPDEKEFVDGYFNIESKEIIAKKSGQLS